MQWASKEQQLDALWVDDQKAQEEEQEGKGKGKGKSQA
jgi:hypothetical protein